jgi:hypothetical protein
MGLGVFWFFYNSKEKVTGVCSRVCASKWEALILFGQRVQRLPMAVGSLPQWRPKHCATFYTVGQHVLASME